MNERRDAAIARPAAEQDGLTTREQLRFLGVSDSAIDRAMRGGVLERMHPGVFRHVAAPVTPRTHLRGAILACGPTAVASHRTAAMLYGFEGIRRFHPEVLVTTSGLVRARGVLIHRTKWLPEADRHLIAGLPVTSAARTALDIGAVLSFEQVERAVQAAVISGILTIEELLAVLERSGASGRNGSGVLRAVVHQSLPDDGVESLLEHRLLALIRRAGLPEPTLQHDVRCADGRVVRLDTAWPEWHVAIEADGHRWHATRPQLNRDLARRRSIAASGWEHHSYGWDDVHTNQRQTLAELSALAHRFASQERR
jgi:very-short-patch-repair endonuclease